MIVLSATDICKSYGTDVILENISFHVNGGDRIGIVGANGAGKTTLLDILSGRSRADSGNYFISGDLSVGYLKQNDSFEEDRTLMEEVHEIYGGYERQEQELASLSGAIADLAAAGKTDTDEYQGLMRRYGDLQDRFDRDGGYSWKSEMRGILHSMAFGENYYDKPIRSLSGGERTRLALACLLLRKPDLLMLDEPPNHLDIGMLKWLEQFLRNYRGTVIMVSHDRYFLDQLCTGIFEVEHHHLKTYRGNYTEFARQKQEQREADLRAYNKQQTEIQRQEEMIRRFKQHGTEHLAKRAASREKRLAQMERVDRPEAEVGSMKIHFHQNFQSGKDVLFAEGIGERFRTEDGVRRLFENVDFDIKQGDRICIVGPNGIGKTTLLRIMIGELAPTEGYLKVGHNVEFGYYDQRQQQLDPSKTVLEEVHDSFRLYKDGEVRGILGRFLFRGDQVFTQVGALSGGEKARLALLKLMLSGTNVLVLDEPTNHLDIDSKEIFEDALLEYPGTVIAVSHDRYFLNRVATKIFELGPEGITRFEGGYDYYEEKRQEIGSGKQYIGEIESAVGAAERQREQAAGGRETADPENGSGSVLSAEEERQRKKQQQAEERRVQRAREKLEAEIEKLEAEIAALQEKMCDPAISSNSKKLRELDEQVQADQAALDEAYDAWSEL